jgi:hypothetical protein
MPLAELAPYGVGSADLRGPARAGCMETCRSGSEGAAAQQCAVATRTDNLRSAVRLAALRDGEVGGVWSQRRVTAPAGLISWWRVEPDSGERAGRARHAGMHASQEPW